MAEFAQLAVDVEPDHLAGGVVILAGLVVAVRQRRALGDHRIVGGVLHVAPTGQAGAALVVGGGDVGQRVAGVLLAPQARARGHHLAPELGLALVHPQQAVAHRHVEGRRVEVRAAAVLAVPRMVELVREQVARGDVLLPLGEEIGRGAVLAGAVVLQPDAAHLVAERDQEIVMVVVVRAVQLVHLLHQVAECLELLRFHLEVLCGVGDEVHVHRRLGARIEVETLEVLAGEDRRVDQVLVVDRLEVDGVALARGDLQRGAGLPAGGQFHAGLGGDLARVVAGRVERHRVPLQVEHFRRHHHAALATVLRRQELELRLHLGRPFGHHHVEGVDIQRIARPRQGLAVGGDHQSGQLVDRTGGRVVAGQPLRIKQGQRTGLRRDHLVHAEDATGHVAGVHADLQAALIGHILRGRDIGDGAETGQRQGTGGNGGGEAGKFQGRLRDDGMRRRRPRRARGKAAGMGWRPGRTRAFDASARCRRPPLPKVTIAAPAWP